MSVEITTAMVKQFSSNVFHLSQQKMSRLRNFCRIETQSSEAAFYDRIGSVEAQQKIGRHSDTTFQDTPHSRRRVTLNEYFHADLVDKEDKLKIIQNPESEYAQAFAMALGRKIDDIIIASALNAASAGKEGGSSVVLPSSQKIVAHDGTILTGVGLNVQTLRAVKKKFNQNETGDSDLFFAFSAEQLDDLLGETLVVNVDTAAIKALVNGDVDSYMGFKFLRTERLTSQDASVTNVVYNKDTGEFGAGTGTISAGTVCHCIAWQKEGVLLAIAQDVMGRIDERNDKHFAKQVYASLSMGGTRLEEEKVVQVFCLE